LSRGGGVKEKGCPSSVEVETSTSEDGGMRELTIMTKKEKIGIAREFRKNQTQTEQIMWEELRNRKFFNLKFITAERDPACLPVLRRSSASEDGREAPSAGRRQATIKKYIEAGEDNF